jgi:alkylated DNA repair dioxygenase AlkB
MDIRKYFKPLAPALEKESQPIKYVLDEESWIEQGQLPNELVNTYTFNEIWRLHPEDYSELFIMGKTVKTPRWVQNYLRSYQFSGTTQPALPLPKQFEPFLMWANTLDTNVVYNQVLVNWYADGKHYIGPHSDSEKQLVKNSNVLSISLGQERMFRIKRKSDHSVVLDINMPHNTYLIMCGKIQERYLHEVPKVTGNKGDAMGKRINITFRVFK